MTDAEELNNALGERYVIERKLGSGGMADVYLARDTRHGRYVALKAIKHDLTSDVGADRFRREIALVAQLHHPHIVPVFDSGEAAGRLWYVMPFVEGESLRDRLDRERQLPLDDIARISNHVASALDEAHQRGILHRDVKPENILLTGNGDALLADFGVARALERTSGGTLTVEGATVGTPAYMSPEQMTADRQLDARSDQYALACVIYEALTGEPPHVGGTIQSIMVKRLTDAPSSARTLRPMVPPSWDAAITRALALAPADRFASIKEFAAVLSPTATATVAEPTRRTRSRRVVSAFVGLTVLLVAAGAWWRFGYSPAPSEVRLDHNVQLTFTGRIRSPAISPDEKQLAYVTSACDHGHCSYAVELQDIGGASTRRLFQGATAAYHLAWSADRRSLILLGSIDGRFGSYLVPTLSGPPRFLTPGYAAFFAGGDSLLLTPTPTADSVFWVRVATIDGAVRDSFRVAGPGNGLGLVSAVPGSPWFVATMFTNEGFSVLLIDRAGRERSRVRAPGLLYRVSKDALWVQSGFSGHPGSRIVRFTIDPRRGRLRGAPQNVFTGPLTGFDVTSDGARAIIDRGSSEYNTYVTNLASLARGEPLTGSPVVTGTSPNVSRLSPDGSQLLVIRTVGAAAGERDELVLMPVGRTTNPPSRRDATTIPLRGDLIDLSWIDTAHAAIAEIVRDTMKFSVIDVHTGVRTGEFLPRDSTVDVFDRVPPDGWVWISRNGQRLTVQRGGDAVGRAIELPPWYSSVVRVRASSDGKALAYIGWNKTTWDTLRVATILPTGGAETPWMSARGEGATLAWLNDGSLLFAVHDGNEQMVLYRVRGPDRAERIASIPWHAFAAELSRDAKTAAVTIQEYRADAWISEVVNR